jgi:hypothetical protein
MVDLKQIELLKRFAHLRTIRAFYYIWSWLPLYTRKNCLHQFHTNENYHCNLLYRKLVAFSYRYKQLVSVSRKVQIATLCLCKAIWRFTWYSLKNRKPTTNNTKAVIRGLQRDNQCYLQECYSTHVLHYYQRSMTLMHILPDACNTPCYKSHNQVTQVIIKS